ncbi:heme ABC exporter ATP-binding protein CcmA [Acetobacteraceae bacterium]|nr:heme ABC exporter ATP-binding protein CcmA [Acetobacteraceae bacterium]
MNSADTLLRIDNILVFRGMLPIFRDISLCLKKGQIIRIHGANGSGKSTLLRVCAGLKKIEKGSLYQAASPCWLGQNNGLKSTLTLYENLSFPPFKKAQEITDILSRLELRSLADKTISSFSSGQKRRAAFAKMLLKKSPLWLLDEPETGLDHRSVHILENEIKLHTQKGGAVLIATHLQKEDLDKNESIFLLKSREE